MATKLKSHCLVGLNNNFILITLGCTLYFELQSLVDFHKGDLKSTLVNI